MASDIDQRGRESFQLHYVEDLSDNPPSRGGTELLLPTIPLTLHAYRDLPLTPSDAGLTSGHKKAQHGFTYPHDTEVYCDSLLASPNPAKQNRLRTESRPLGRLRHEGVVVCATVPATGMKSRVLTSSKWSA